MSSAPAAPTTHPFRALWRERVIGPVRRQLMQGASPEKLALSIAVSTACSLLPFLGFTTLANVGAGFLLRLNQPVMQIVNYLLGAVQLALIIVYVRLGEKIWGASPVPISVSLLTKAFRQDPRAFLRTFGATGVHAATAWIITAPVLIAATYFPARLVLRQLARRTRRQVS